MEDIKQLIEKEALKTFEELKKDSSTYKDLYQKISTLRLKKTWEEKDKIFSEVNKIIFERISDLLQEEIETFKIKKQ